MNPKIFPRFLFSLILLTVLSVCRDHHVLANTVVSCAIGSPCTPACNSSCTWYSCDRVNAGEPLVSIPVTLSPATGATPLCSDPTVNITYLPFTDTSRGKTYLNIQTPFDESYDVCTTHVQSRGYDGTWSCPGPSCSNGCCAPPAPTCIFCGDNICNGGENCATCPGDCGACPTWRCRVNTPAASCTDSAADLAGDVSVNLGTCTAAQIARTITTCVDYTGPKNPPYVVVYCSAGVNVPGCGVVNWVYEYRNPPFVNCTIGATCP